jgi:malate/lactate dehydrogenase
LKYNIDCQESKILGTSSPERLTVWFYSSIKGFEIKCDKQEEKMEQKKTQIKIPSVNDVMGKKLPETKFRSGAIAATIWANETVKDGKKVVYKSVSFERSYKDKNDAWQSTNSLRTADIPKAILVLSKAYEHLALNAEEEDIY